MPVARQPNRLQTRFRRLNRRKEYWHPPEWTPEVVRSAQIIENFARTGDKDNAPTALNCQQFLDWLINVACGTYDEPFRPDNQDAVNYMLGRRSVGLAVVKLLKLKPDKFSADEPRK